MTHRLPTNLESLVPSPGEHAQQQRPWRGVLTLTFTNASQGTSRDVYVTATETNRESRMDLWPGRFYLYLGSRLTLHTDIQARVERYSSPICALVADQLPDPVANVLNQAAFNNLNYMLLDHEILAVSPLTVVNLLPSGFSASPRLRSLPALLCVRTGTRNPTLETTPAHVQLPVGPQPQLLTYEAHPNGAGGLEVHAAAAAAANNTHGSPNEDCKVRTVCAGCNKGFGRAQELARHKRDVHEGPRNCLFCEFKWTRPCTIKAHLFAKHSEKFTAENLVKIQALRGRMIVAFLEEYK